MADLFKKDNYELRRRDLGLPNLKILLQMANGWAYLHSEGIIHGDIKPENILISLNDPVQMKLADFGISKEATSRFDNTTHAIETAASVPRSNNTGFFTLTAIRGSEAWFSPEILKADEMTTADRKGIKGSTASDVFAYGLVSFYYVTRGIHPFGPMKVYLDVQETIKPNIYDGKPINFEEIGK